MVPIAFMKSWWSNFDDWQNRNIHPVITTSIEWGWSQVLRGGAQEWLDNVVAAIMAMRD
jgi:hypothetical protein